MSLFSDPCGEREKERGKEERRYFETVWRTFFEAVIIRGGNELSRARLGLARCGSLMQRAELGSARPSGELENEARLGSLLAREPARRANEPSHKRKTAL
jgi:hypothetical protein